MHPLAETIHVWRWLSLLLSPWTPSWRVEGAEHLPVGGPFLLASNHLSPLDPLLWVLALGRAPSFVADPCASFWLPMPLLQSLGVIVLPREAPRMGHLVTEVRDALERGQPVAMFPEGLDAFETGTLSPFHRGLAVIWERVDPDLIPLIPGAIVPVRSAPIRVPGAAIGRRDGSMLHLAAYHEVFLRIGRPIRPRHPFDVDSVTRQLEDSVRGLLASPSGVA